MHNNISEKAAFVAEHFDASEVEAVITKIHSALEEDKELTAGLAYNELLSFIETTDEELTNLMTSGYGVLDEDNHPLPPPTGGHDDPTFRLRLTKEITKVGPVKIYGFIDWHGGGGGGGTGWDWKTINLPGGETAEVPDPFDWDGGPGGPMVGVGASYRVF